MPPSGFQMAVKKKLFARCHLALLAQDTSLLLSLCPPPPRVGGVWQDDCSGFPHHHCHHMEGKGHSFAMSATGFTPPPPSPLHKWRGDETGSVEKDIAMSSLSSISSYSGTCDKGFPNGGASTSSLIGDEHNSQEAASNAHSIDSSPHFSADPAVISLHSFLCCCMYGKYTPPVWRMTREEAIAFLDALANAGSIICYPRRPGGIPLTLHQPTYTATSPFSSLGEKRTGNVYDSCAFPYAEKGSDVSQRLVQDPCPTSSHPPHKKEEKRSLHKRKGMQEQEEEERRDDVAEDGEVFVFLRPEVLTFAVHETLVSRAVGAVHPSPLLWRTRHNRVTSERSHHPNTYQKKGNPLGQNPIHPHLCQKGGEMRIDPPLNVPCGKQEEEKEENKAKKGMGKIEKKRKRKMGISLFERKRFLGSSKRCMDGGDSESAYGGDAPSLKATATTEEEVNRLSVPSSSHSSTSPSLSSSPASSWGPAMVRREQTFSWVETPFLHYFRLSGEKMMYEGGIGEEEKSEAKERLQGWRWWKGGGTDAVRGKERGREVLTPLLQDKNSDPLTSSSSDLVTGRSHDSFHERGASGTVFQPFNPSFSCSCCGSCRPSCSSSSISSSPFLSTSRVKSILSREFDYVQARRQKDWSLFCFALSLELLVLSYATFIVCGWDVMEPICYFITSAISLCAMAAGMWRTIPWDAVAVLPRGYPSSELHSFTEEEEKDVLGHDKKMNAELEGIKRRFEEEALLLEISPEEELDAWRSVKESLKRKRERERSVKRKDTVGWITRWRWKGRKGKGCKNEGVDDSSISVSSHKFMSTPEQTTTTTATGSGGAPRAASLKKEFGSTCFHPDQASLLAHFWREEHKLSTILGTDSFSTSPFTISFPDRLSRFCRASLSHTQKK